MTRQSILYKPGFDGPQADHLLSPSEEDRLAASGRRHELISRIHTALLVAAVEEGGGPDLGIGSGDVEHIVEFSDMVGQDEEEERPPRFRPSPGQVDDMVPAMELLDGLRLTYLRVAFLRALWQFHEASDYNGRWSWSKIGERCGGYSEQWAADAYSAVIVQAARRSGLLPMFRSDHAILLVSVRMPSGAEAVNITTAADPRQQVHDLKSKSPLELDGACAIWTAGKPLAKRLCETRRAAMKREKRHGTWYWGRLDEITERIVHDAQQIKAPWRIEDIGVGKRRSATS